MTTVVVIALAVLGMVALIGGLMAMVALRKARDGFEDDKGFHPADHSNQR